MECNAGTLNLQKSEISQSLKHRQAQMHACAH